MNWVFIYKITPRVHVIEQRQSPQIRIVSSDVYCLRSTSPYGLVIYESEGV